MNIVQMITIFCALKGVFSITQYSAFESYSIDLPSIEQGNDLLLISTKSPSSGSILVLASLFSSPLMQFSQQTGSYLGKSDFNDFQSWVKGTPIQIIRIPRSQLSSISINVAVYTDSSSPVDYTMYFAKIAQSSCEHTCYSGSCSKGVCSCSDFSSLGYDCSLTSTTLAIDTQVSKEIGAGEWRFFRIASTDSSSITAEILNNIAKFDLYTLGSNSASSLPCMLNYDETFNIVPTELTNLVLSNQGLNYWLMSIYCHTSAPCQFSIKLKASVSSSLNFLWIIIASIISLAIICIATPIILRIIFRFKQRNASRIAEAEQSRKKEQLNKKFPVKKFEEKSEKTNCTICFEEFKVGAMIRQLSCCHIFHCSCIDEWFMTNATCPLCKRDMLENDLSISQIE